MECEEEKPLLISWLHPKVQNSSSGKEVVVAVVYLTMNQRPFISFIHSSTIWAIYHQVMGSWQGDTVPPYAQESQCHWVFKVGQS